MVKKNKTRVEAKVEAACIAGPCLWSCDRFIGWLRTLRWSMVTSTAECIVLSDTRGRCVYGRQRCGLLQRTERTFHERTRNVSAMDCRQRSVWKLRQDMETIWEQEPPVVDAGCGGELSVYDPAQQ